MRPPSPARPAEMASPTTTARRKFWGWGLEHEGLDQAELEQLGADVRRSVRARRGPDRGAAARRGARPAPCADLASGAARERLHGGSVRAGRPQLRQVLAGHRARLPARVSASSRPRRLPAQRGRRRGNPRVVHGRARGCDPLRRRLERGGRRRARCRRELPRHGQHRPPQSRPGARGRFGLARGADPGRDARPGARSPAEAARLHAAPLPPVVRVVDARRLDRDPLRRALRDAAHAHRRVRRGAARGDAPRDPRDTATAGLGRRPFARPALLRIGRHARRDHGGVDAPPGPPLVPGGRLGGVRLVRATRSRQRG